MDIARQDIDRRFGPEWFPTFLEDNSSVAALPYADQLEKARMYSVHGQTDFFRDDTLIPVMDYLILPRLHHAPARVASVGCSDGREVYSLLLRYADTSSHLVLHGYDVNPELVAIASQGGPYTVENSKLEGWARFNAQELYSAGTGRDTAYKQVQFNEKARLLTQFFVHDIVDAPLPKQYDLVLLQNVLCHYAPLAREQILAQAWSSLRSGGWLVCERYDSGSANAEHHYDQQMKDIRRHGFRKAHAVIPTYWDDRDDISCWTRVYRKIRKEF